MGVFKNSLEQQCESRAICIEPCGPPRLEAKQVWTQLSHQDLFSAGPPIALHSAHREASGSGSHRARTSGLKSED